MPKAGQSLTRSTWLDSLLVKQQRLAIRALMFFFCVCRCGDEWWRFGAETTKDPSPSDFSRPDLRTISLFSHQQVGYSDCNVLMETNVASMTRRTYHCAFRPGAMRLVRLAHHGIKVLLTILILNFQFIVYLWSS